MQIEEEVESTVSTLSREDTSYRQGIVDSYTHEMINEVLKDPYISIPRLIGRILRLGPLRTKKQLVHVYGGKGQFGRTCGKLEWIRWAVATDNCDELPIDWLGDSDPAYWCGQTGASDRYERYIRWWAPDVLDTEPYDEDHTMPSLRDRVYRYPSQEDTEACLASQGESNEEQESSEEEAQGVEDIEMVGN